MSDWTDGYVADIGYTFGYYAELNTLRLRQIFLHAGLAVPEVTTACELGFGQGLSANLHAAGSVTQWYGTDFNPSQAAFAQQLADVSGSGAQLFDQAFEEFSQRKDLPDFDYIGLHGIWSWISNENRAVIVDFIQRKLKVGGVLYISYNTQPGWAAMVPLRDLLTEHYEVMGAAGQGLVAGIDGALAFADQLFAVKPKYALANPNVAVRLGKIKEQNRNYLAHEYFNRDWSPMTFSRVAEWLAPAKLSFACSAHYFDHVDALNLTAEQQALLKEIPDPMFRQTVRDFCVNQQFRRDYWVKGGRQFKGVIADETLRAQRLMLVQPRADISLKVPGVLGEANMQAAVYHPILDFLADYQPKSFREIELVARASGIRFEQVKQALMVLAGVGAVLAVQDDSVVTKVEQQAAQLNAYLCNLSRNDGDIAYLVSPVTGGGIPVSRFNQLFLLARSQGHPDTLAWAQFVWDVISLQEQCLIKDGQPLLRAEENIAELLVQANIFVEKQLPLLLALGIAH